jgi:alanine racemase
MVVSNRRRPAVTASAGRAAVTFRPTFAEVDLGSVRHNVRALRPDGVELMAVVKADGYGHGSVPVARAALEAGATWLGVALVEEGIVLRDAGIEAPILVLTEFPPGSERDALARALTPSVYTDPGLSALVAAAGAGGVGVHVKLDTGMHRVGLPPERTVAFVGDVIDGRLRFDGLWTHLATSEDLGDPFMGEQLGRFGAAVGALAAAGIPRPRYLHAANTGGVLAGPEAHLDLVRVGIGLYGVAPGPDVAGRAELRPVMAWTSRVAMTKRVAAGERLSYGLRYRLERASTIATVPVGYADGYSRRMSDGASVLIGGRRHPVAGTVTMDQILVDCGDAHVAPGDDVVLLGAQGHERISADEMASWTGTIAYEVLCGISERVPRTYADVGGAVVPMAPASGAAT